MAFCRATAITVSPMDQTPSTTASSAAASPEERARFALLFHLRGGGSEKNGGEEQTGTSESPTASPSQVPASPRWADMSPSDEESDDNGASYIRMLSEENVRRLKPSLLKPPQQTSERRHSTPDGGSRSPLHERSSPSRRSKARKVCRHWVQNRCYMPEGTCNFVHSLEGLTEAEIDDLMQGSRRPSQNATPLSPHSPSPNSPRMHGERRASAPTLPIPKLGPLGTPGSPTRGAIGFRPVVVPKVTEAPPPRGMSPDDLGLLETKKYQREQQKRPEGTLTSAPAFLVDVKSGECVGMYYVPTFASHPAAPLSQSVVLLPSAGGPLEGGLLPMV